MFPHSDSIRRVLEWVRRHAAPRWREYLALRERFRVREETFHLVLAVLVGMAAGVTNFILYLATEWVKWLALRRPGDPVEIAEMLAPWARLVAPTAGACMAGMVLHWGLRLAGPSGASNLLEVVVAGDGRLPFKTTLVRTLSSLLSFGTGASVGREGPLIHLSAMLASKAGQLVAWPPYRLRLLLACGAAAGMAASYNVPIAGAVFAAQIVLGNFAMNLFAPLVCASVAAAVVSRSFFGIEPWYHVPDFQVTSLLQLPWFLFLGVLSGGLGALFLRLLREAGQLFDRTRLPIPARLVVAGLFVGALAVRLPEVWGNGYSVTSRILSEDFGAPLLFLAVLLIAKLAATVVSVGAGTVGGVFTPTLFLGAALGGLYGEALHIAGLDPGVARGAFALVGMGSMLAATTHSPLLAIILVFEISLNYGLMPPLMLACAIGTLVGRRLHPDSVYTEPLRLKGLLPTGDTDRLGADLEQTVGDFMRPPVKPLAENAPLREIADRFLTSPNNFLPVVDTRGRLLGVVALQDLKGHLNAGDELRGVIAVDLMRPVPPCLTPGQKLHDVLPVLLASEMRNIPVVDTLSQRHLLGALPRHEALGLIAEALASRPSATP